MSVTARSVLTFTASLGSQRRDIVSVKGATHFRKDVIHVRFSLFGATVTSWKVDGQEKLFLSSKSQLDASKPVSPGAIPEVGAATLDVVTRTLSSPLFVQIRGGVPICFVSTLPQLNGIDHDYEADLIIANLRSTTLRASRLRRFVSTWFRPIPELDVGKGHHGPTGRRFSPIQGTFATIRL